MRRELSRVVVQGSNWYLLSEWRDSNEDGFDLLLAGNGQTWQGRVLAEELRRSAQDLSMRLSEYAEETHKALCQSEKDDLFDFSIEKKGTGRLELIWKKKIPGDTIKFQLGCTVLQQCANHADMLGRMFDFAIDKMRELQDVISDLEKENIRLSDERSAVLNKLEQCVDQKDSLESELFGKFKVLINSKKAKIRQLKEQVEDARQAVADNQAAMASHVTTDGTATAAVSSDQERDSNEIDFDDSQHSGDSTSRSRHPRSSQFPQASLASDGLLDDDDAVPAMPLAKRRRHRAESSTGRKMPFLPPSPQKPKLTCTESTVSVKRHRLTRDVSDIDDSKRAEMLENM